MMAKEKHKIVYLDDEATDRKRYKELLEADNRIEVVVEIPTVNLESGNITKHNPALVIIDYLLDTKQSHGKSATYKGSTLAATLREKLPYTPLILLTRGSLINRRRLVAPAWDFAEIFDVLLLKDDIIENAQAVIDRLVALVEGFNTLHGCNNKDFSSLRRVLGAEKDEYDDLLKANPPRDPKGQIRWRVPQAARWIQSVIIHYPGILFDSLHSATLLGIDESSFLSKPIQKDFKKARYSGLFSTINQRWWKQRLLFVANSIMNKSNMLGDPATHFLYSWKKSRRSAIEPSVCIYSDKPHADCVCYILNKPVLREYSLPYIPDNRPAIMEEARCSFTAIRESNDFDPLFIREDARPLVREIQKSGNI